MKPMLKEQPYASIARQGVRNQGGSTVTVRMNANTPQKKISTQTDTTIFSAAARPTRFPTRSSATSSKILFHCFAMYSPGACPFSMSCASHALYTWLARSPASMRGCHQHGTRINTEIANLAIICDPKRRQLAESKLSPSISFSANRRPRFGALHRAAFYYFPLVADAHILT